MELAVLVWGLKHGGCNATHGDLEAFSKHFNSTKSEGLDFVHRKPASLQNHEVYIAVLLWNA